MLITVNGNIHRLFFEHTEVRRQDRYKNRKINYDTLEAELFTLSGSGSVDIDIPNDSVTRRRIAELNRIVYVPATVCRLDRVIGTDGDGKRIWETVAESLVVLNHQDQVSKSEAATYAFRKMLAQLRETSHPEVRRQYSASDRASIASQYFASKPHRPTYKELKARVRELEAALNRIHETESVG